MVIIFRKQRLDVLLASKFPKYSRVFLQKFIREKGVNIGKKLIRKPHAILPLDFELLLSDDDFQSFLVAHSPLPLLPSSVYNLPILFENNHCLVIDKPPFLAVADIPVLKNLSFALVHRLDKDTSGILVIAKNPVALAFLQEQWSERTVKKVYLALVKGGLPQTGRIEGKISRSFSDRKKMSLSRGSHGREAVTEFSVLKDFGDVMLVEARPITGRTHQIRVHFSAIKHPIIGDKVYGEKFSKPELNLDRQFLHATRLTFFPSPDSQAKQKSLTIESFLPEDLKRVIDSLR